MGNENANVDRLNNAIVKAELELEKLMPYSQTVVFGYQYMSMVFHEGRLKIDVPKHCFMAEMKDFAGTKCCLINAPLQTRIQFSAKIGLFVSNARLAKEQVSVEAVKHSRLCAAAGRVADEIEELFNLQS